MFLKEMGRLTDIVLAHVHANLWLTWSLHQTLFAGKESACQLTCYDAYGKTKLVAAVTGSAADHNLKILKVFYHVQP